MSEAHIHRDTQRANNEAGQQKNKADCHSYFLTYLQPGDKGGNAGDGREAGPVLGRHWPAAPAAGEDREGNDIWTGLTGLIKEPDEKRTRIFILSIL
jgi:hypothetical protein